MSRLRHRKARRRARLLVQILDETQESLPIKIMKYYLLFSGIVVTIGLLFLEYKEKAKMKSYPIWNNIKACIYKSDKSYGVKETGDVEIRVGTSASNSHLFLRHSTTHRIFRKWRS